MDFILAAFVAAFAATLSGFGIGFLWGYLRGTNTVTGRLNALMAGLFGSLLMVGAQMWLVLKVAV
jgi:ABC-type dipeptide/oligopeptide/nickel transport system permease subunit